MELQQTPLYASYMALLGWDVSRLDEVRIFSRHIPLAGGLAKIQRPEILPDIANLTTLLRENLIRTVVLEPSENTKQDDADLYLRQLKENGFKISRSPYLPTKTIRVDLTPSEDTIFRNFSEAKRRAVRRAKKAGISIKQSQSIYALTAIKAKSAGFLGSITTYGLDRMWEIFAPQYSKILLAYAPDNTCVGGVLLIYCHTLAYYWIAGATKIGKKLFAPTLLAWEAIKISKKLGYSSFDFVGAWDERNPNANTAWKGFTKFKEGFGGNALYYPISTQHP